MPDLGPMGRGGARRRTRRRMSRRMTAVNESSSAQEQPEQEPEIVAQPESTDKLEKLAKLLKDKGVITESEYDLLFG